MAIATFSAPVPRSKAFEKFIGVLKRPDAACARTSQQAMRERVR
jgi:hypothetical protein